MPFNNIVQNSGLSLGKANNYFVKTAGGSIITCSTSTTIGVVIKADTSQSANLLEIKDGSNNLLSYIDKNGNFTLNSQNSLIFADADSSNYIAFKAPTTVVSNVTYTLPPSDGTVGQVLSTDGNGNLNWISSGISYSDLFENKDATFDVLSFSDALGVSLFCDYYVINTTYNYYRAGTIVAVWNKNTNTVTLTDNSTNDLDGSTSDLYFSMSIVSDNVILTSNIDNDIWSLRISYKIL
jgi:hypothetical protein